MSPTAAPAVAAPRPARGRAAVAPTEQISDAFISEVRERLAAGKAVHRTLAGGGVLHLERPVPFLVVYREPSGRADPGTDQFVQGEAAHLAASGARGQRAALARLVDGVLASITEAYGAVMLIELWAAPETDAGAHQPLSFAIHQAKGGRIGSTVDALALALGEIRVKGSTASVESVTTPRVAPPGMTPLVSAKRAAELNCAIVGIAVPAVYRDLEAGQEFPLVRRALHRGVSRSIQRAVFEFTRRRTSHRPAHYLALGRRSFVKTMWDVDRDLAVVSNSFDFLLQITPVNVDQAWAAFRRRRFEVPPDLVSRPLRLDPSVAKRELFKIPVERVEDPTLAQLFRDQQSEIDRKLTMLGDRGTPRFLYGSLQVYGGVDAPLLAVAHEILDRVPVRSRGESLKGAIDARRFAARAEAELTYYRERSPDMPGHVEIRGDVSALTVSRGNLLVPASLKVPDSRVDALIAHEVGTHVVTYTNGRAQRFRQLYVGLPGYEELQEGLAVLAEYLVGGLSRPRLRLLAARVVATDAMVRGASFVEVFRELDTVYAFSQRTAFSITVRVFRGGGLTKDVSYLRGLVGVLDYLGRGGDFETLLLGKFGPEHIPIIEELRWRKVLVKPVLRPRYLDDPDCSARLGAVREGATVLDLTTIKPKSRIGKTR